MESREWKTGTQKDIIRIRTQVDRILKTLSLVKDIFFSVATVDPIHAGLPNIALYFVLSVKSACLSCGPDADIKEL